MASRPKAPAPKQPARLSPEQMRRGIKLLQRRIAELQSFDPEGVTDQFNIPQLTELKNSIESSLIDVFGCESLDYDRYNGASWFNTGAISMSGNRISIHKVREEIHESKDRSLAILNSAVKMLNEKLDDDDHRNTVSEETVQNAPAYARKAFIIHGHDTGCLTQVELFLSKIAFDYVVLNQQPNSGRTVIEKIEAHSDVGFAIVLLTPDDQCQQGTQVEMRARQNVLWEYGYFVGRLGRARVCVLKRDNVKIPSDLEGIGWTGLDAADGWKIELARELKGAGYSIDMNKVVG